MSIKLGLNGSDGMSTPFSLTHFPPLAQVLSHRPALSQGKRIVPTEDAAAFYSLILALLIAAC